MSEELGRIEKPPVEEFESGRKIFFVPLIFSDKGSPADYTEIYNRYWEQVDSQISNLETKLGNIKHIYHELVPESGDEGLQSIQRLSPGSYQLIQKKVEKGSTLDPIENEESLKELMDWSRCLSMGLQSQNAYNTIYKFYTEASNKRSADVLKIINDSLKDDDSALLVMSEGYHIQFPNDIKVIYVSPPALNDIKRWVREYQEKTQNEEHECEHEHTEDNKG